MCHPDGGEARSPRPYSSGTTINLVEEEPTTMGSAPPGAEDDPPIENLDEEAEKEVDSPEKSCDYARQQRYG
jgi:hypothetical protein